MCVCWGKGVKVWRRGRKLESMEGLTMSLCNTAVFHVSDWGANATNAQWIKPFFPTVSLISSTQVFKKQWKLKTRLKQTFKSWEHQSCLSFLISYLLGWTFHADLLFCVCVCVSAGIWSPEDNSHRPGPWPTKRHRLHNRLRSESHNQSDIHSTEKEINHILT